MNKRLKESIEKEIAEAERLSAAGDHESAFTHLERAHVLGQSSTYQHTRVHILMAFIRPETQAGRTSALFARCRSRKT
jgi:predicted Zn-dependent protease